MGFMRDFMVTCGCGLLSVFILSGCGKNDQQESTLNKQSNAGEIRIANWGPQDTQLGEPFNVQPDGSSALWIEVTGVSNSPDTQILFGNRPITAVVVQEKMVTFVVPKDYLTEPGTKEIKIREGSLNRTTLVGQFTIKPKKSK